MFALPLSGAQSLSLGVVALLQHSMSSSIISLTGIVPAQPIWFSLYFLESSHVGIARGILFGHSGPLLTFVCSSC